MTASAERLRQGLQRWAAAVQTEATADTAGLVRYTGDVPIDTGELRSNIGHDRGVRSRGTSYVGRLWARTIQAVTTDKGARPHVIVPRRAGGLLVFNWPKAGGTVALRRVNHPGNRPQRWWGPAVRRAYPQALRLAARRVPFR